jgi:hypothetical protein
MTWNLFLDDERFPPDDGREWVICRTCADALVEVLSRGFPNYVSFDHDLGHDKWTGHEFAKHLVENDIISGDKESRAAYKFAPDFDFYVHSQNPIGKANIEGLLNNYLTHKNTQGAK